VDTSIDPGQADRDISHHLFKTKPTDRSRVPFLICSMISPIGLMCLVCVFGKVQISFAWQQTV